jgi:hypothetical protein
LISFSHRYSRCNCSNYFFSHSPHSSFLRWIHPASVDPDFLPFQFSFAFEVNCKFGFNNNYNPNGFCHILIQASLVYYNDTIQLHSVRAFLGQIVATIPFNFILMETSGEGEPGAGAFSLSPQSIPTGSLASPFSLIPSHSQSRIELELASPSNRSSNRLIFSFSFPIPVSLSMSASSARSSSPLPSGDASQGSPSSAEWFHPATSGGSPVDWPLAPYLAAGNFALFGAISNRFPGVVKTAEVRDMLFRDPTAMAQILMYFGIPAPAVTFVGAAEWGRQVAQFPLPLQASYSPPLPENVKTALGSYQWSTDVGRFATARAPPLPPVNSASAPSSPRVPANSSGPISGALPNVPNSDAHHLNVPASASPGGRAPPALLESDADKRARRLSMQRNWRSFSARWKSWQRR